MPLTSRERLLRALSAQEMDRIPIYLLFPFHRNPSYVDVSTIPCYRPVWEAALQHTDFFDRRSFDCGPFYSAHPDIRFSSRDFVENGCKVREWAIEYHDIVLTRQHRIAPDGRRTSKALLETIADLQAALALPYVPPQPDVASFHREAIELGERGVMMANTSNALSPLHGACSPETLSLWSVEHPGECQRFLDVMQERCLAYHRYLLEAGIGPTFFLVGSEFAGPPLVSPRTFDDWVVRYDRPLIDLLHSYAVKVVVHYHGQLRQVLQGMAALGMDGLHTVEAPPVGDCTLAQARAALGDSVCLIGNLQYDDLARCAPEEIDRLVREAISDSAGGPFILSPTAGPYEATIPERMVRNYLQMIESGLRYGLR